MKRLLEEAKWTDGAVWTVLMIVIFAVYETQFRAVVPDGAYWLRLVLIWSAAGAGYAILAGWLSRNRDERKQ